MHAFCGCDTGDVLSALGLCFSDLFPEPLGEFKPERRPFDPMQVLEGMAHEIIVAVLIANDIADGGHVNAEKEGRLRTVARRLNAALEAIGERSVPDEIKCIRRAEAMPK
jgi:hypothetical protein